MAQHSKGGGKGRRRLWRGARMRRVNASLPDGVMDALRGGAESLNVSVSTLAGTAIAAGFQEAVRIIGARLEHERKMVEGEDDGTA